jgi:phosphate transport system permease protein
VGTTATSLTARRRRTGERVIKGALLACGVVAIAATVGIILSLAGETISFFRSVPILKFLTGREWAPTFNPPRFGFVPLLTATLIVSAIAAVVAFPLGLGTAIYLSEFASARVRKIVKPTLEVLAGIPTVVFGYFALLFVTPSLLQHLIPGVKVFNGLSAGVVVGIMILPLVASISEDAMRAVPMNLREAAFGLGSTKRVVARKVVVPAALSGIGAAFILGLSRAVGETMIVAIAAGQQPNLSADPRQPMETMTTYIVKTSLGDTPAGTIAYKTIFALGATLFVMTLVLNVFSQRFIRRFREKYE